MNQLTLLDFDYQQLDTETRIVVQQRTTEIKALMKRTAQDIIEIGQKLIEVKERLPHGAFGGWLEAEFNWTDRTARKYMAIAKTFKTEEVFRFESIGFDTLALLASPSTPEEVRQEAIERVSNGETVTYSQVKNDILPKYQPQPNGHKPESKTTFEDTRPLFTPDEQLDSALDDTDNFICPDCGEVLDFEVWHCQTCNRHWPTDKEACPVCEESPKPAPAMSQELQVLLSHESTEWYTPSPYIEAARRVMGDIDLDPANSIIAQEWIKASQFYTRDSDGLSKQWYGRVWLNPPYSKTEGQSNQELWSQKLIEEYEAGRVTEAILLVKASIGYNWFDRLFDVYPVCLVRGLISFIRPDGQTSGPAKLGSAFFYLGPNLKRFDQVFRQFGRVIPPEGDLWS